MAHATKCAAPESNRGRGEWMTVIEMQGYMRASRNKAYDLIWSGEIDSYRLGRKLLVSRASVDAYIESRSGRGRYIATKSPTTCSRWAHTPTRR